MLTCLVSKKEDHRPLLIGPFANPSILVAYKRLVDPDGTIYRMVLLSEQDPKIMEAAVTMVERERIAEMERIKDPCYCKSCELRRQRGY